MDAMTNLAQYKVVGGDTLRTISQKFYGTPDKWQVIYDANKAIIGANPDLIKPGQMLSIPSLTPGGGTPGGGLPATYTVVAGDTLSGIAQRFYGSGDQKHVRLIFRANKAIIGDDPRLIKPGQKLTIPKP